jgi:phosphinothricin acetyltransferase
MGVVDCRVRRATRDDLPAIVAIYNPYVRETAITFDLEEVTLEQRTAWFQQFDATGRHQIFVAEVDGAVVGYAHSGPFRGKAAYDPSVECTVYLAPDAKGNGIGRALYTDLFAALREEDVRRVIAGITLPNPASIALHERFGFTRVGVMTEVGRKFDRYHDVVWMELAL